MRFLSSLIRFVPDPARGEFVNVGVIVGSDASGEWDIRMASSRRARRVDEKGVMKAVWLVADDIGRRIDRAMDEEQELVVSGDPPSESWLHQLYEQSNNIVQFSPPTPISADSARDAVEYVFSRLVLDPESAPLPYRRKSTAVSAMRAAYTNLGLRRDVHFMEHYTVQALSQREKFDFVVANGRAVQLAQAWSFQIPNQHDVAELAKAYAFTVRDLRRSGGGLAIEGDRRIEIPPEVDVAAICIPPIEGMATEGFDEARAAFADAEVRIHVVTVSDVIDVARHAQRALSGHAAHA